MVFVMCVRRETGRDRSLEVRGVKDLFCTHATRTKHHTRQPWRRTKKTASPCPSTKVPSTSRPPLPPLPPTNNNAPRHTTIIRWLRSAGDRSKRQERVGHVVRSEIATILHNGSPIKYDDEPIEDELRKRINVINANISPDLRQARVTVSVMAGKDDIVAKRRAYAWLVRCTKSIRHALAQKMKHMKASPDITFVWMDVGAAVDVMQLIEKVS